MCLLELQAFLIARPALPKVLGERSTSVEHECFTRFLILSIKKLKCRILIASETFPGNCLSFFSVIYLFVLIFSHCISGIIIAPGDFALSTK